VIVGLKVGSSEGGSVTVDIGSIGKAIASVVRVDACEFGNGIGHLLTSFPKLTNNPVGPLS
jgi:hypothetical protein